MQKGMSLLTNSEHLYRLGLRVRDLQVTVQVGADTGGKNFSLVA